MRGLSEVMIPILIWRFRGLSVQAEKTTLFAAGMCRVSKKSAGADSSRCAPAWSGQQARGLHLDGVDRITTGDEERLAVRPTKRVVGCADLPFRFAAEHRHVELQPSVLPVGADDADAAFAGPVAREEVAFHVHLDAVAEPFALDPLPRPRPERAVGLHRVATQLLGRAQAT